MVSELPESMVWCLTLIWEISHPLLFEIFLMVFSLFLLLLRSIQSLRRGVTFGLPVDYSTPGFPVHRQFQKPTQTHVHASVMPSNHLLLYCPLLLLPSIFPSIRAISNTSVLCIRWPKYCSFLFRISPSNEYSGLISSEMDWLDLLAVQDSHESSPMPQLKSINSSLFSFLYAPTITPIHDYWKNHSFD